MLLLILCLGISEASLALTKEAAIDKVTKAPKSLQTLEAEFKKDKDVVTAALRQNPDVFLYADESLKKDRGFVMFLLQDKAFVLTLVKTGGASHAHADLKLSKDKDVVLAAIRQTDWLMCMRTNH